MKTIQRKVILYKKNDARARKTRDDGVITVRFLMSETLLEMTESLRLWRVLGRKSGKEVKD